MSPLSHLGPHTYVSQDAHHRRPEWVHQFKRSERQQLIDDDRRARNTVLFILALAMLSGMSVLVTTLLWFV